jgi:hypothetical protein
MSSTILGGDFTVYYDESDSGGTDRRQIKWTGTTGTRTVNELYSALQDLFDDSAQMDDRVPMSAQTPTDYTMINNWYIDDESVEYLTGGTIQTNGWASDQILQKGYNPTTAEFVAGDIGKTIVGDTTGDSGTILDFNITRDIVWIRPDVPGAGGDEFDNDTEGYTVTSGTGDGVFDTATSTGEAIWANPNTIGTISDNTQIYIIQNGSKVVATKGTDEWWGIGQIDILLKVQEAGTLIDDGEAIVLARQYSQLYSHSVVDLSAGARTPVALATGNDLNNNTGNLQVTGSSGSGTFQVGEVIEVTATDKQGVVTRVTGTESVPVLDYYLIGSPQTDFVASDTITGVDSGATCTAGTPDTTYGPSATPDSDITIVHAATDQDLNNGSGSRPYSITIDCQYNGGGGVDDEGSGLERTAIGRVYEYTKHALRRGSAIQIDSQDGEQYIGSQLQLEYDNNSGANFTEGLTVTGGTSGAFGVIVANHDDGSTGDLILRNVRGTFQASEAITDTSTGDANILSSGGIRTITTPPAASLGTFAGGTFFGAPGVWLVDYAPSSAQAFQLTDDNGVVQTPPNTVTISVTNLVSGDTVAVFRRVDATANSDVDKEEYASDNTLNVAGDTTFEISTAHSGLPTSISNEVPQSGKIRVIDTGSQVEHRYRYSSFSGTTFTLDSIEGNTSDAGGSTTLLSDASEDFVTAGVEVGDLVSDGGTNYARVTSVATTQLGLINIVGSTNWASQAYEVNTLVQTYDIADNVWVPFIDTVASATSVSTTIIQTANIPVRVVVRNAGTILPFETDNTIGSAGMSQAAIRNPDAIYV